MRLFRVFACFCFLAGILLGADAGTEAGEDDWKVIKAEHFLVYYKTGEAFARDVARKSDGYYNQIGADLGYERYSDFWLWDNRAKVFIHPTEEEFQKVPGTREWSTGLADYNKKEIYSYSGQSDFTESVLPHEITHLIFREFVGTSRSIPLWLDEGIAQWEEPQRRALATKFTQTLLAANAAYTVGQLFAIKMGTPLAERDAKKFYMQSVSLVDFLIRTYGGRAFTAFCRQLRDGQPIDEALRKAYPGQIRSMEDLDAQWKRFAQPA